MKKISIIGVAVFIALLVVSLGLVSVKYANPQPSISIGANTDINAEAAGAHVRYVALGDSVAAGVGLKDDSDSSACNRTNQAYPNLVAANLGYKLKNLACSGATLPAGITGSQDVNKLQATPQLQQLFDLPKPDVISLTIGANDAQWTTIIGKCYTGQCGSAADSAAVAAALTVVGSNLTSVLNQIKAHYALTSLNPSSNNSAASQHQKPLVVITGYHQVFPVTVAATCTDLSDIDAAELAWGRTLQASINTTLQNTVKAPDFADFAKYVPVDFNGHELCSTDPWVQGLADKQPYHPTSAGQAAFAQQIAQQINLQFTAQTNGQTAGRQLQI